MSSDESTVPDTDFEDLLRSRLRELADHAPTTVPPPGSPTFPGPTPGARAVRTWRSSWMAAAAGTALVGAGLAALVVVRGDDADEPVDTVVPVDSVEPGSTIPGSTVPATTAVPTTGGPTSTMPASTAPGSTSAVPTSSATTVATSTVPTAVPSTAWPPPITSAPLPTSPPPTNPPSTESVPPVPTIVPPSP